MSTVAQMMSQFYSLGNCVQSIMLVILVILERDLVILDVSVHKDFMGQVRYRCLFENFSIT